MSNPANLLARNQPTQVAAADDERYTSSVRRGRLGSFRTRSLPPLCSAMSGCVSVCVVLCVSWSCGCRSHWIVMAAWMLHGLCFGEETAERNLVFFRVKWLQPTMKGTSSVRRVRLGSSGRDRFNLCVVQWVVVSVCVVLCVSWSCGCRSQMAAWMLHGLCFGEEAGARNLAFFCVKWLQPTMKGTSSVRRVRLGSFRTRSVPPLCSAMTGCVCVRRSMRLLNLWLPIAM